MNGDDPEDRAPRTGEGPIGALVDDLVRRAAAA